MRVSHKAQSAVRKKTHHYYAMSFLSCFDLFSLKAKKQPLQTCSLHVISHKLAKAMVCWSLQLATQLQRAVTLCAHLYIWVWIALTGYSICLFTGLVNVRSLKFLDRGWKKSEDRRKKSSSDERGKKRRLREGSSRRSWTGEREWRSRGRRNSSKERRKKGGRKKKEDGDDKKRRNRENKKSLGRLCGRLHVLPFLVSCCVFKWCQNCTVNICVYVCVCAYILGCMR